MLLSLLAEDLVSALCPFPARARETAIGGDRRSGVKPGRDRFGAHINKVVPCQPSL